MSKYDKLWRYVQCIPQKEIQITFERAEEILGFSINHSFLNYKKEAESFGWSVKKISLKNRCILLTSKDKGDNNGNIK